MRVIIVGGGVVGVTSAWYLARAGHQVVVVDRQPGTALETSFANAGEISPGYASPWAAPSVPLKALRWMFMQHAPLIIRPQSDAAMLRWMWQMLANCTPAAYRLNKERMVRLAEYSRDELRALRAETGIRYDERAQGTVQLFRKQKDLDAVGADIEVLRADGVPFELLDRAGCLAAEPGLAASQAPIVGGLRLPDDETGDCFLFTNRLAKMATSKGVEFRLSQSVTGLDHDGGRISGVKTDSGDIKGDCYLVAAGCWSPHLLAPLGIRLPVYPVKGYSITLPITDDTRAPVSTVLDETYKIAITRLGGRIRVGGMAELSGYERILHPVRRETLEQSVQSLFPGAAAYEEPNFWCGLRPMTPDSTPVIGPTRYENLFLNSGHGTLGWTMACGSGRVIADIISGTEPAIEAGDLAISRYR